MKHFRKYSIMGLGFLVSGVGLAFIFSKLFNISLEALLIIIGVLDVMIGGTRLIAHTGKPKNHGYTGLKAYARDLYLMGILTGVGMILIILSMSVA